MKVQISNVLLATLALSACGEAEKKKATDGFDDAAAKSALFLTAEDLGAKNTQKLDGFAKVQKEVNGLTDLYANAPDEPEEDKTLSACVEKNVPFKVQVEGNKLIVAGEAQPFECKANDGTTLKYSAFRVARHAQCEELTAAVKALNGKSSWDLEDAGAQCVLGKEARSLVQFKATLEASGGAGADAYKVKLSILKSMTSADSGPCVWKANVSNDCVVTDISSTSTTVAGKTTTSIKKTILTLEKLKQSVSADQKFFDGGAIALTLADWSGSVTFTAKDAAPKWSLKRGTETLAGTFGETMVEETSRFGLSPSLQEVQRKVSRALSAKLAAFAR